MGKVWELDFYSRPILDENKKKQWEVLICETQTDTTESLEKGFRYTQFCPPNTVNSLWLREAIETAMEKAGETPSKIRFFRRQMNNMIVKACEDAGLVATPSRRTYTLNHWLNERQQNFYPNQEGYNEAAAANASVAYPPLKAIALPDAVRRGAQCRRVTPPQAQPVTQAALYAGCPAAARTSANSCPPPWR